MRHLWLVIRGHAGSIFQFASFAVRRIRKAVEDRTGQLANNSGVSRNYRLAA